MLFLFVLLDGCWSRCGFLEHCDKLVSFFMKYYCKLVYSGSSLLDTVEIGVCNLH